MTEHVVADAADWDHGECRTAEVDGVEVVVVRLEDGYYAYRNQCLHQGGPLEEGSITGTWASSFDREALRERREWVKEGTILNCPWHGWEYDLETGDCLARADYALPAYDVEQKDGAVVLVVEE